MDALGPGAPLIMLLLFVLSGITLVRFVLLPVTVDERFSPPLGIFSLSLTGSAPPVLSLDLTATGFLIVGRGLASFFSASLASILLSRSSLACLSFAATSSPGSLKVACVIGLLDFGAGGGVGNCTDIGRRFIASGFVVSEPVPTAALGAIMEVGLSLVLVDRPSVVVDFAKPFVVLAEFERAKELVPFESAAVGARSLAVAEG